MEFIVLRRANQSTERGDQPPALEPGVFLRPSDSAVRLSRRDGVWELSNGPYAPRDIVAGITPVQAASRADVIEQVRWWPLFDAGAVYEIRDAGTGGAHVDEAGTAGGQLPQRDPALTRYVVFLRADADTEANRAPSAADIARMAAHHEAGVRSGMLLAACALAGSASATRVYFANAHTSLVAGPFADVRELVAGYWIVQAASLDAVLAWVQQYPYPHSGALTVEIREACERREQREFTPAMRAAEERLRAELLEETLRAALGKKKP